MNRVMFLAFVFQLLLSGSQQQSDKDHEPRNFSCTERSSRSVVLIWNPPNNTTTANGSLSEYRVRVSATYNPDVLDVTYRTGLNRTNVTVSCLQPNTSYTFVLIPIYKKFQEKYDVTLTVETLPDDVDRSFSSSLLENWEAMLVGAALMLLFLLLICGIVVIACRWCVSRKTVTLPGREDSVLQARPWAGSRSAGMGERYYSVDPTTVKASPPPSPRSPMLPPAAVTPSEDPNAEPEPPQVPSWPGSTCVSQNLEELQDQDIYQNEIFTSSGADLPIYSNEVFDGQGAAGRRNRRRQPNETELPVYGNYQF